MLKEVYFFYCLGDCLIGRVFEHIVYQKKKKKEKNLSPT